MLFTAQVCALRLSAHEALTGFQNPSTKLCSQFNATILLLKKVKRMRFSA